jgi:hypothetical protein
MIRIPENQNGKTPSSKSGFLHFSPNMNWNRPRIADPPRRYARGMRRDGGQSANAVHLNACRAV